MESDIIFSNFFYCENILAAIISTANYEQDYSFINSLRLINKTFASLIPENFLRLKFEFFIYSPLVREATLKMLIPYPCAYEIRNDIFMMNNRNSGLTGPHGERGLHVSDLPGYVYTPPGGYGSNGLQGAIGQQGERGSCTPSNHNTERVDIKKEFEKQKQKAVKYIQKQQNLKNKLLVKRSTKRR